MGVSRSFLFRKVVVEGEAGECRAVGDEAVSALPDAKALSAGASRDEVDRAPPKLLPLSLRAIRLFAPDTVPARNPSGDWFRLPLDSPPDAAESTLEPSCASSS